MRFFGTLTALVLVLTACGDDSGGVTDAGVVPDAGVDARVPPADGGCPYTESTRLLEGIGQVGFGPIRSDGDRLYYITEGAVLSRILISDPAAQPEALQRDVSTFLLDGERVFFATTSGVLGEVEAPLTPREIARIGFTNGLHGSSKTLYYCDQNMFVPGGFQAVDVDSGRMVTMQVGAQLFDCVRSVGEHVYWPTGATNFIAATRLARGGLGQGVVDVVSWPEGFQGFEADERGYALRTPSAVLVGDFDEEPRAVPFDTPLFMALRGDHVYFTSHSECRPNGFCAQAIHRGPRTGGDPEPVVVTSSSVTAITADDSCVYWVEEAPACVLGGGVCSRSLNAAPAVALCSRPEGTELAVCNAGAEPIDAGPPPDTLDCGDAGELYCVDRPAQHQLNLFQLWSVFDFASSGATGAQVAMQPIVTRLNDDDGDGEIQANDGSTIVMTVSGNPRAAVHLVAVRGDMTNVLFAREVAGLVPNAGLAAGDIDGDGWVEIVGVIEGGLVAFEHDGTQKWRNATLGADLPSAATPALADMDGDGAVEVIAGRAIVSGADGTLRRRFPAEPPGQADSLAVDLDADGVMELVLGNAAYDLDGTLRWSRDDRGGYLAVANFDEDDAPELVVVGFNAVTLLDTDGAELWSSPIDDAAEPGAAVGGPPVVADFDGDALPEVGVASARFYSMFDGDGTRRWQVGVLDNSEFTGSVAFDFDQDGIAEIVHAGTAQMSVLSGLDGRSRYWLPRMSMTGKQSVTIADLDMDSRAELIVPWDGFASQRGGFDVLGGSQQLPWAARTWNQYDYTIGNTLENGHIPAAPEPSWLVHNTFRAAGLPRSRGSRSVCECKQ